MSDISWLAPDNPQFPPVDTAQGDPNGLLAAGGALTTPWLLSAYQQGIFPWFEEGQPILWWSPDPRLVLSPSDLHISRSMRKFMRKNTYRVTFDQSFLDVLDACAQPRDYGGGTWITDDMRSAYNDLYESGYAHSVEVWNGDQLVGGLYGVSIGSVFFGESMFALEPNVSKLAFIILCQHLEKWGFSLIDCQVETEHLSSLGAYNLPRKKFVTHLKGECGRRDHGRFIPSHWAVESV